MSSQIKETCCDGILASLSKMLQTVCSFFKFPFRVGTCFSCYVMIHGSQSTHGCYETNRKQTQRAAAK